MILYRALLDYTTAIEVMGLVRHTNHLKHVLMWPHTISFPRIQDASEINFDTRYFVKDHDFARLIAILRLAVPYKVLYSLHEKMLHYEKR
jgi:2-iminoacetate synthase